MRYLPAVALLIIALVPVVPAQAAPVGDYYLQSVKTGDNLSQVGSGVELHHPKGNEDNQQWKLRDGRLENATTGSCLNKSLQMVACASDTWTFNQVGDQWEIPGLTLDTRWYLTPVSGGTASFPADPRLDEATFLVAHNAFANGVDGGFAPPFLNLAKNQTRGIVQQLGDGVRGFMLDIHQTPDGAILCHNSCTWVSKPVALWVDLQRIVDFLRANPSEIVTVFLEDYVSSSVLGAELARVNGLSSLLFRPDQSGVRENGWPTLSQLRASGKRLLIFTDHARDGRDSYGVMYGHDWTVENYWSMGGGLGTSDWSCYTRWSDRPLTATDRFQPLFVMNHFRDTPFTSTATTDNSKLADRAQRFCQPAARKKPTYLAVDHYNLGNAASAVTQLNTYTYRP
ncbi:hypothetical protein Lesp02_32680 [Lentzea sp. NBRC 105346]|uniref:PI-PLC domain-containing protein n=1 Tax=Lentzea sp. NBRC 105346 TaxID=3032205 RepID=UPI0024A2BD05|nr:PI-PLC domain-containing protein [Lentzea sp. NBRC 105346]GLZ31080.1 hypothetical protein Lesp02_32680 [Lentzea sp. NBRC 105346]